MTARLAKPTARAIHNGDKTHNQDHVMQPVSFKPMNRTVSKPQKPTPLELDDDFDILSFCLG